MPFRHFTSCCRQALLATVMGCVLVAAGCGTPLPEPTYRCTTTAHCAEGFVCAAGVCIGTSEDVTVPDAGQVGEVAQTDADVGTTACTKDADCALAAPCVTGTCQDGECLPVQLPNGATCTDGGICPTSGHCSVGICTLDGAQCDDAESCTFDSCDGQNGCKHAPFVDNTVCEADGLPCTNDVCKSGACTAFLKADSCLISGACVAAGTSDPKAPCNHCAPEIFSEGWTGKTSGPCDDGDACTINAQCTPQSQCVGEEIGCNDNNVCTNDSCDVAAGCVYLSNSGTCTDDDPCTLDGDCIDGNCKSGGPTDCDDANPCTKDACIEGFGCAHSPKNGGDCLADTDPCTDDVCKGGNCVAVPSVSVCKIAGTCVPAGSTAAANPCKICSPQLDAKKWTVLDGAQCSDGDACTSFDSCAEGTCVGEPAKCTDNNNCTTDGCDKITGCTFKAASQPCDDDDKCTKDDFCVAGKCVGASIALSTCDDNNPCTVDLCQPSFGCSNKPQPLPCDDGDKCTKNDLCSAGKCVAGFLVCPCETDADCNDNNSCTTDKCVIGQGCENATIVGGSPCDDNDKCTANDQCSGKVCAGTDITCDDNNTCTKDSCVAELGCAKLAIQGKKCDDGDLCTSGDLCLDGVCGGTPKSCDDANACTSDSCDPKTAKCTHVVATKGSACPDDNIACTVDQCVGSVCDHGTIAKNFCLVGGACLSGGALHPAKQCTGCQPLSDPKGWSTLTGASCADGDACTVAEQCDEKGGCTGKPADCNDGNPCTKDTCNPQAPGGDGCLHNAVSGGCSDDDACTKDDACAAGICKGTAVDCDDKDPCTDDSCLSSGGCIHKAKSDGQACPDDGLDCTSDVCLTGQCRHQIKSGACRIGTKCYSDGDVSNANVCVSCQANKNASQWSPISDKACNDGDICTGADTCSSGVCLGDKSKACDDQNVCTADTCDVTKGCSHTPTSGACEDGNLCTVKDVCKSGKCVAGEVKQCPNTAKAAACEYTACLPAKGCANVTTCGPLHACDKGLCVTQSNGKNGPVTIDPPASISAQPIRPSIRWQDSASGALGAIPRLWLAAQTSGCDPGKSAFSGLFTAAFAPTFGAPTFRKLKTLSPTGSSKWCAVDPVFRKHPTTFDAIVLGWLEGGDGQSGCALEKTGGLVRVGLAGLNGAEVAMSVPAKCPSGSTLPLLAKPDLWVLQAGPQSNAQDPAQLGGLLARASNSGPLLYNGNVVGKWGANSGTGLPPATLTGYTESPDVTRPVFAAWTSGSVVMSTSTFKTNQGVALPGLTGVSVSSSGVPASKKSVLLTGVALTCSAPKYVAVAADYDPDVKRVGVLVSGTCMTNTERRGFLSFARVHPDQAPSSQPKVAVMHAVPKSVGSSAAIDAFAMAQLPNSPHFLVVWAAPSSSVIKAFRVEPKDDATFKAVDLGAVASNFAPQTGLPVGTSNGGLSELVVAPDGERYSLAWESVGSLQLLTAPIPK